MATEYKLSYTAAEIDKRLEKTDKIDRLVSTINGVSPDANGNIQITTDGAHVESEVLYTKQNLTDEQKVQARANIGALEAQYAGFIKHFLDDETSKGFINKENGDFMSNVNFRCTDYVLFPMLFGGIVTIKSTIYGYSSVSFYDKNKNCILSINADNISDYGYNENLNPIERSLPAPENTMYIRFATYTTNGITENDLYIHGQIDIRSLTSMAVKAQDKMSVYDRFSKVLDTEFEIGGMNISTGSWSLDNNQCRVRLKHGVPIKLFKGSEISVSKDISFYVGWRVEDELFVEGWITKGIFVAPVDGEYVFTFRYQSESEITSVDDISSKIKIIQNYYYNSFNEKTSNNEILAHDFHINPNVKGVNHRGFNIEAPENTMPAFKMSRKNGFVYVECDVDYTSDGEFVIIHDPTINRTARNIDGTEIEQSLAINNITYEQALTYDFGIFKGSQYAGTKIPKFEEFIKLCKAIGIHPYIELKFTRQSRGDEFIRDCCDIVKKYGMAGKTTWIHTETDTLNAIKQNLPEERFGLVCYKDTLTESSITNLKNLKTDNNEVFVDICYQTPLDDAVNLCKNNDIPMEVWTLNSKEEILNIDPYISGVTSDSIVAERVFYEEYI